MHSKETILITGARGMVGRALIRRLQEQGSCDLLTPTRNELDCTCQKNVRDYLFAHRPSSVIVAAARVGGIYANMTYPADFIYTNLMIACNLIHESYHAGVERLLYLGSTCIYPRDTAQPIVEEALLTGPLESTNEAYALAKIAGVKLCQHYRKQYGCRYISAMPTNLYGPGDNYHPEDSHVIPGLIRRFHEAKQRHLEEVLIWGTGMARREFLYVDDLAEAALFLLDRYDAPMQVNIGSAEEVTILEIATMVAKVVGYGGRIGHDLSKPEGTFRKKTNLKRITELGWSAKTPLEIGLQLSYQDYIQRLESKRSRIALTDPVIS